MNFQFAAVAGAGVDVADRHRLAEHLEDFRLQCLLARAQGGVAWGAGSETKPVLRIFRRIRYEAIL